MSKPPKLDRKSLKKPDEFVVQGTSLLERAAQYQKQILIGAILIVVGAAAYYSLSWWNEKKLNEAWTAYNAAVSKDGEAKWDALASFQKDFSSTRPGYLAAVALGDRAYEAQMKTITEKAAAPKGQNAVYWYTEALAYGGLSNFERQLILINRGKARELNKQWGEALRDYEAAVLHDTEAAGLAALSMGRALEQKGDKEKASNQYEKVATEYADTEYARLAKIYRRTMNNPLLAPAERKSE